MIADDGGHYWRLATPPHTREGRSTIFAAAAGKPGGRRYYVRRANQA